jgi:hypothetical protein
MMIIKSFKGILNMLIVRTTCLVVTTALLLRLRGIVIACSHRTGYASSHQI